MVVTWSPPSALGTALTEAGGRRLRQAALPEPVARRQPQEAAGSARGLSAKPNQIRAKSVLFARKVTGVPLDSAAEMAGERTKLIVAQRSDLGSRESRRLRAQGLIPGVLYGRGEPVAITIAERELRRALTGSAGLHSILDVEIDGTGTSHASILKDYQVDAVRGGVTHVDLQEVRLDQPISASVTIHLLGAEESPGVREGGVAAQPLRELSVEALPLEIPEHFNLDVSGLAIGDVLRVSDLQIPAGVTVLDDPETVIATVAVPSRIVEAEVVAEGEEGEGGEAAEGEAAEGEADAGGDSES